MAKFFVGQRVRIKWSKNWPELAGQEGVISGSLVNYPNSHECGWPVSPDSWGSQNSPYSHPRDGRFAPGEDQLEPILPEGAQPLGYSFEQMMSEFGVTEAVK